MKIHFLISISFYALIIANNLTCAQETSTTSFVLIKNSKADTLFVNHHPEHGTEQYSLVWKRDTITKEWSYDQPHNFFSSMDTLNWYNLFLLAVEEGDGCPVMYKILAFKEDKSYFLSKPFGNCESLSEIKYNYPFIIFYFNSFSDANIKKAKYAYNGKTYALSEK